MGVNSDQARLRLRELADFAAPWAVWIAATLRLPDHIESGATSLEELAGHANADPDALRRLLQYLVGRGVFAEADGAFANTDLSRLLLDAEWGRWFDLDGAPGVWAESWARLLPAVRTGSPGRDEGWYYGELARTGRGASFDAMMAVQAGANAEQVAGAFDWSSVEHVVDVGGGTGVMLHALLAAYPRLRATLFDLPQVVAAVPHENRLDVVAGSVFDDPLPRADAYVLSRILHGWPDSKAEEILELCAAAGGEHVRVLLVESVLSEPPSVDEAGFDLFMLTLTGGRERNLDDFRRVASAAGLELRSSVLLASGSSLLELAR